MANRVITRQIRGSFPAGQRRKTEWFGRDKITAAVTLAGNTILFDSSLSDAEKAKLPFTVVRVRGSLLVLSDQTGALEEVNGAIGMAVVSDKAVTIGVTALPAPGDDISSDLWFLWMPFAYNQSASTSAPVYQNFDFDSKAMRKVADGSDMVMMIQNNNSTFGMQFILNFRILVKLA